MAIMVIQRLREAAGLLRQFRHLQCEQDRPHAWECQPIVLSHYDNRYLASAYFYLKLVGRRAIKGLHSTGKRLMTATECVSSEYVILVDDQDNQIGLAEKLEAHQKNLLHRAFSAFVFRRKPRLEI